MNATTSATLLARVPGALLRAARMPASLARAALGFALPQRCPSCGREAEAALVLCASCRAAVPRLRTPLCARCLVSGRDPSACTRHRGQRVHAPWLYDDSAAAVVHALKYGGRPAIAAPLGPELAAALPAAWRRPDLVLEVPLHAARERERGYNQAAKLADALAGTLRAPRWPGALRRVRATRPQARTPDAAVRRANMAGAFAAVRPEALAGRRVLVVDDVMTTGATLAACLDVLGEAGAEAAGVTLAWTP